ncbi:MAG TPA: hypothetical protein DCX54_04805 [Flavobacteriales bacterium]|nr:hypothetical protein [Flavobacteriales bacterium]
MKKDPIYLAGIERSGTSLMYALLASHPNIAMMRRTYLWMYFNNKYGDLNNPENFERCISVMSQYTRLQKINIDVDRIRREFSAGERSYARLFSLIGDHFAERKGKQRWGDKSLNTEKYMDDIFAVFPRAKIIHMMRDPRDRYASAKTRWTQMKGLAGAGTKMWTESVRLARRGMEKYPENYMVVRYEDVVSDPEETLRNVCEFLEEEYVPEMVTMKGSPTHRDKGGNSSYGKREVGVISTDSLARYKRVLSVGEIKFMQDFCKSGMLEFGYKMDEVQMSWKGRLRYLFVDFPLNFLRMLVWSGKELIFDIRGRKLPARRLIKKDLVKDII